jgi:arylsulfatase A-like enzyme
VPPAYFIDPSRIDLPVPTEDELRGKPRFEREQLRIYTGGLDLSPEQIGIARGTYYGMVSLVDVQVGRLVDCLRRAGVLDNTILAINSDQGWQLGEHGLWKKRVHYDDNVKAPLVLSCPARLPQGKVVTEPVEMIDFIPTLMDLSGLEVPNSIRGRSLMPLIRGDLTEWREACFCEIDHSMSMYEELRQRSGRRVMVRTREWKLDWFMDERVADKDGALYNLQRDPNERVNLYGRPEYADVVEYLERLCYEWDRAT